MEKISSLQNPRIKALLRLEKAQERKAAGVFTVEGCREIVRALRSGYELRELYHCPAVDSEGTSLDEVLPLIASSPVFEITRPVFDKIAWRENQDGLFAVMKMKDLSAGKLRVRENALILVLESVEKPGNLGAILRTADAAGADAVLIADPRTDVYNPNAVRASLGCLFSVPLAVGTNEEILKWLRDHDVTIYSAIVTTPELYHHPDYRSACAFVLGTEANGLSEFWHRNCDKGIRIPMHGIADSLNVSSTAAILVFEALRQRNP